MRRLLPALLCGLLWATSTRAQGLLIPTATDVPPLAMHSHEVKVIIEDQVAVTNVVQTFRNNTDRPLEATYVFPVPKGASVKKFTMWVDGKEVPGELVEADKARTIYTDIVRRTQDPGLLEYLGNNLLRVRVFPVPARGDQKLAVSYTSIAGNDAGLIEYVYPLRADGKGAGRTLEKFSLEATLKAQHPITNVYSPTHAVTIRRPSDRQAVVRFEKQQAALDKDFQLYYAAGAGDVGLTALTHRPSRDADGHFLLLISPRAELSKRQQVPRDLVFVLDTSGSMRGARIQQARNALNYCLRNLDAKDRFGLIHFATTVNPYNTRLLPATRDQLDRARQWVDNLEATGSTNIDEALAAALAMRPDEAGRSFTVVFFTDGQPTIGETDPAQIVKNVVAKNTANTRIFTFGVGDDVNAVLLDQLADKTRSVATYVRESEDIEAKVSGLYAKISRPVLTDLKLSVGPNVTLTEVYPPHLPDLFDGSQLVVLGRYHGKGAAAVTLTGTVGKQHREFAYEVKFPGHTGNDRAFVEDLWARRKVGYLLDQIRVNGEKKEVVDEVVKLAKRYGITTPYTSYLVVPDGPTPVASGPQGLGRPRVDMTEGGIDVKSLQAGNVFWNQSSLLRAAPASNSTSASATAPGFGDFARQAPPSGPAAARGLTDWEGPAKDMNTPFGDALSPQLPSGLTVTGTSNPPASAPASTWADVLVQVNETQTGSLMFGARRPVRGDGDEEEEEEETRDGQQAPLQPALQSGKLGVDLSLQLSDLRNQTQLGRSALRQVAGRTCVHVRGAWIDQGYEAKMPTVAIKAMSPAYFRLLERQPQLREVFQLGKRVVWVTPNRTALVIDTGAGRDQLPDAEIDRLFVARK